MSEQKKLDVVISYKQLGQGNVKSMNSTLASSKDTASNLTDLFKRMGLMRFANITSLVKDISGIGSAWKSANKGVEASKKALESWKKYYGKILTDSNKDKAKIYKSSVMGTLKKAGLSEEDREAIAGKLSGAEYKGARGGVLYETKELDKTMTGILDKNKEKYELEQKSLQKLKDQVKTAAKLSLLLAFVGLIKKAIQDIKDLMQLGDDIDKASQKALMSTDAYQEWAYVLDRCGIEASFLQTAMRGLQRNIATVESLGLKGETLEDTFAKSVKYVQSLTDEFEKLDAAVAIFGRNGSEMMTLFNMSVSDTERLKKWYNLLGGKLSSEFTTSSATFQDNLTDLKQSLQGIKVALLKWIVPLLNKYMPQIIMFVSRATMFLTAMFSHLSYGNKTLDDYTDNTKSATKATEELKRSLAGFDELNVLSSDTSDDTSSIFSVANIMSDEDIRELELFAVDVQTFFSVKLPFYVDRFKNWFNNFFQPFLNAIAADALTIVAKVTGEGSTVVNNLKAEAVAAWSQISNYQSLTYEQWSEDNQQAFKELKDLCDTNWGIDITRPDIAAEIDNATKKLTELTTADWVFRVKGLASIKLDSGKTDPTESIVTLGSTIASMLGLRDSKYVSKDAGLIEKLTGIKFASGGVLTTPTVGLMGEYANARSNPEIVTPQNIMYETVQAANGDVVNTLLSCTRQLLQGMQDNKTEVSLDGQTLAKSVAKANNNYKLQTGGSLL